MSFIILGNQRSGTSYLLDLMNQHPLVDTINEPFSMHLDFFRVDESKWSCEDYDESFLHADLKALPQTQLFIQELDKWMNFEFSTVRGFKETALFEKYGWLQKAIHFNHTIIIIRDFRAVIYSVLRRNLHLGWWNYEERLQNFYHYSGPKNAHILCAEILKRRTNYLMDIIHNNSCYILRLEDVMCNPIEELERLMNYIGLEINEAQIRFLIETSSETRDSAYSNFRRKEDVLDKWKNALGAKIVSDINSILNDQINFFGYRL